MESERRNNVLIAGGSGEIGTMLSAYLIERGYNVSILSRSVRKVREGIKIFNWNPAKGIIDEGSLKNQDYIINLSGVGIADKLWTKSRKKEILESRLNSLNLLEKTLQKLGVKPDKIISVSAVGYYGNRPFEVLNEENGAGGGYLADVCTNWEQAAHKLNAFTTSLIVLRIGVVISPGMGFVRRIAQLFRFGVNIIPGNGKQYMPWIGAKDLIRIFEYLMKNSTKTNIYNAVSSHANSILDIQEQIADYYRRKLLKIHVPAFLLRALTGSLSQVFLNNQHVKPAKLIDEGFDFREYSIRDALQNN
ncbi:MAG: TIGR01777 family oxidoreductase [Bacteroidales bacterium]|nr:TIGR01777 family oxidoreductase [Bacteroidales bacterium]MBN2818006.1 TIGR01777 family oxidoreductase [Bacteroidales bacterium]